MPLRVYLYGGLKTHAPGTARLPAVPGRLEQDPHGARRLRDRRPAVPVRRELASADVLVIYKGDAGYLSAEDRAALDSFLRRGGGIVTMHDALCGPEPEAFAGIVGGAKKHGEVNYTLEADVPYTIVDTAHPIMQGMTELHHQG